MAAAADRPFLIAQITDLHVVEPGTRLQGEIDTNGAMARCATRLAVLDPQPDLLVITGDLTDTGTPAAYAHLRDMLAPLRMPVYVLPGNHDRRADMRAAFAGTGALPADDGQPFLQYTVEDAPLRLIVPWKYGFKSIKSIVRITLTDREPPTSWNKANAREYGFYSNVNPNVDHPRWSQATERRIGGGLFASRQDTLMFNGYPEVAPLYAGQDLSVDI